jgi:glycerophosphoryl diester phosphodiesterase
VSAAPRPEPLIAAHRGGAQLWPENTALAFREAAKLAVEQVEFDVRLSRDGIPYVFHDATLDRVTDARGPVDGLDWAALSAVRVGGTEPILTLDDALDLLAPSHLALRIEIKPRADMAPYPALEAMVLGALARRGLLARGQITSFRLATLATVRGLGAPGLGLLWLLADPLVGLIGDDAVLCRLAREAGAAAMAMRIGLLTPDRVAAAAAQGIALSAYATHGAAEIAHARACGVAVFTTDRPDLALAARRTA